MNKLFILLLLTGCFGSCKKKNAEPPNNNEIKATVVLSSGSTININATGSKVLMGCSFFGGTYVDGTNAANAAVSISPGLSCVTSPGTYNYSCEYRQNVTDPFTPIYRNNGINPGSITFTSVSDHYMEGHFTAVCRLNMDSVIITGTFKGDHLTH